MLSQDEYRAIFRRAAALFSAASGYRDALERTLAACLPALGDFGFFDARDGDDVVRIARAHEDPALDPILRGTRWVRQSRPGLNLCALSSGEPALHPAIDDAWYREVAAGEEHLALLRRLGFASMVTVPMRYGDELIGALTLFMGRSGRRHAQEHVEVAADIAGFAAPVVAHAQLLERHHGAQAALRESEEHLRVAYRAAGLGAWEWNVAQGALFWSPEYRQIYGIGEREEVSFQRGMAAVLDEDKPAVEAALAQALSHRREYRSEHRVRHPQLGLRWIAAQGRPEFDQDGRPLRLTGMVMDVTERKLAERELESLRERLAEELNAMHRLHAIGSRIVGRGERVEDLLLEILDAALEITGRERGIIQLLEPETSVLRLAAQRGFDEAFCEAFARVDRRDPMPSAEALRREQRIIVRDVREFPLLAGFPQLDTLERAGVRALQSTPLVSRDGRVVGIFTTHWREPGIPSDRELRLLDLLSRAAADLVERSQAQARLAEADRRKDEFLAILAHELRNPLAPIRYAVSIVRQPQVSEAQRAQARNVIERQVQHMGRLLDDLLDVSRIARGTVVLKPERVELAGVIQAALEASRPLLEGKRHALDVALPDEPVTLEADPVRLTQIVSNLLNNAAKYTDPGGEIDLRAGVEGRDLVISVRDSGIGIPTEMKPRLFTLFSQADSALHRAEGGLGIGLALVKGFVALHGGSIEARSEGANKGSEFVVRLPVVDSAPQLPLEMPAEDGARRALRVLVADDNGDICETCATLLRLWGHEPYTAANGADALGILQELRPQVALLDIGMPRLNGYEVAERTRRASWGRDIALVAVTGWGQEEARQRAAAAGFDYHLTKPVDTAELERILGRVARENGLP